ncbi:MAG TPA: D-glycero-beta-D-manno-heptose 1-phosphate adenylyltransferase [Streptosporangiaceae bacterium]|nr:D-glycero-beta-D-manno-heptose 1-phosphate adenylyltransferase [Streptosporangiaceae bacterium]
MRGGPLVVVGDTLLDVDLHGTVGRVAPDAPVPVVDCQRERHRAGGAGLAAVLAAGFGGADVVLITALGQDRLGGELRDLLGRHVQVMPLPLDGGTPCKIRVHASGQPVVRLDAGDGRAHPGPADPAAERALRQAGAVLVADYGRGVAAHPALTAVLSRLAATRPVVWDPHPAGGRPLPGSRLVTPSQGEARVFAAALDGGRDGAAGPGLAGPGLAGPGLASAAGDAAALSRAWGSAVAVTLGEGGALLHTGEAVPLLAPAEAIHGPHDACGAGDCFAAAAAQVLRSGGLLSEAVTEAVRQATDFVRQGGASASPGATIPREASQVRAVPPPDAGDDADADARAWRMVTEVRARGGRIVATGGCFDLLHAGHVGLLREARRLGDCLVVCLNSDASVRALKGPGRPLVPAEDRARILAALECVDAVVVFGEQDPAAVLERLRPDVWVKGGDYAPDDLTEAPVVRRHGGEVVLLPYLIRHSTTDLMTAAQRQVAS